MLKMPVAAVCAVTLLSGPALGESASPQDLTVRPGDTIEWSGLAPHRVRFGGTVGSPPVSLTPLPQIDKILGFSPPLSVSGAAGSSDVGGEPMLTAVVKDGAAASGVTEFNFTSGRYSFEMVSLPIRIESRSGDAPRRTLRIKAVGRDWMLEKAGGYVKMDSR